MCPDLEEFVLGTICKTKAHGMDVERVDKWETHMGWEWDASEWISNTPTK